MSSLKYNIDWSNPEFYEEHLSLVKEWGINIPQRKINITGEINNDTFKAVEMGFSEMEAISDEPITLRINSEGGAVYEALAIIGLIRRSPCVIVSEGYGSIMSSATLIMSACDERSISEYAYFMYHEMSYGSDGTHTQNKALVEQAEKEKQNWSEWMSEFSKKNKNYWYNLSNKGDVYLTANELLKIGCVDKIIQAYKRGN